MKSLINISSILFLLMVSGLAQADIKLTTSAEIEVTKVNQQGIKRVKRVPASHAVPGNEVIYTITAKNTGKQAADKIVVTNPIPQHTVYVTGSAFGKNTDITFSVDSGKTYAKANQLIVKGQNGKTRRASANEYTNVRWVFGFDLKPGAQAQVGYRVKVK